MTEQMITGIIYIHALLGGIGLLTGIASIVVKKGGTIHKKTGNVFYYSMLASAMLSIAIAMMPKHVSPFLLLIGVFTTYLVLGGKRALSFKNKNKTAATFTDKLISTGMLLAGFIMVGYGIYTLLHQNNIGILFLFFGAFGLAGSIRDFVDFKNKAYITQKNKWLKAHLGSMVGALIASVTAFMVAGLNFTSLWVWLSPTCIGTAYIIYWGKKVK
jgi:uncharacterized membrane protein